MVQRVRLVMIVAAVALVAAGCSKKAVEVPAKEESKPVKGRIVSLNAAEKMVTIDHQDIPGIMPAMTMPFQVADAKLLEGLAVGDVVEFVVAVTPNGLVVTKLRKLEGGGR